MLCPVWTRRKQTNDYFSKCFNRSQPPLQTTDCLNYPLADDCPDEILCTESEVTALLMTLDIAKASGPDGISVRMLRETAEHISPSLTKIFNLSIKTGSFPSLWKKSNIVPIPKANYNHNPSNYRPISLLSILGKLLEKHVHHIMPSMCPATHSLPMYSGDSKVESLP